MHTCKSRDKRIKDPQMVEAKSVTQCVEDKTLKGNVCTR